MGVKAKPYWGTLPGATVDEALLPEGWKSYRLRQRNDDWTFLFIRYPDGIEYWVAGVTEADLFVPLCLQGSNRRGKAT